MSRLPPAEKLPLAVRKNLRDEWESKIDEHKSKLSGILGAEWTFEINPLAIFPYATDDWAKTSLGSVIANYVSSAIERLETFANTYSEEGKKELNDICHTHVMTLDVDLTKSFTYCGVDVHEGRLRLLFAPTYLGTNIYDTVEPSKLLKALNDAPPAPGANLPLSYSARTNVRLEYDEKIEETRMKVADMLGKPDIKFVPNFEDSFAKLKAEAAKRDTSLRDDWESQLGYMTRTYFEGLADQLQYQKFDSDDMLKEGLLEAVETGEMAFRLVEKLKYDSYCECDIEDGRLYLQAKPQSFGTNVHYAAQKLLDRL